MTVKSRFVFHETQTRAHATRDIADAAGLSIDKVRTQIEELNERLKHFLGYDRDPITVSAAGAWRVDGVAGLVKLNDQVELELVPKFLDPKDDDWRSDFLLLALMVKTGHLLVADRIQASVDDRGDLATLVARSLLHMHEQNHRRPIRSYKRVARTDFSFDGDVDWDTLLLPEPDGFRLQRLDLAKHNAYNAVLKAAVDVLVPEVGEGDTRAQLQRLAHRLGDQPLLGRVPPRLPARHQSWRDAYSLSQLVLDGMGLDLNAGQLTGPGFVISTWEAWETLCEEVIRRAMPGHHTVSQYQHPLGIRENGAKVVTKPDVTVMRNGITTQLIDAKYKTRQGRKPSISSTDLYESLAFLRAANSENIVLLYPALDSNSALSIGEWKSFDVVHVDGLRIQAAQLQIRGLARRGGVDALVSGTRSALSALAEEELGS